ncbi:MAG: hypothetical protein AABZ53_04545 [Planctomycetota bacterium]
MIHALRSTCVLSLIATSGLAAAANAQPIAYEGFDYPSLATLLGQSGGSGFTTPWQTAGYGSWAIDGTDSVYVTGGLKLLTSGGRASTAQGGYQRTLNLATPLGNTPGSVWVSFVARQTAGTTPQSWLGITLPCTGSPNPWLFLGKAYGQSNWGTDAGLSGTVLQTTTSCMTQALIVARIDFRAGADDVHVWINPSLSGTPSDASADLSLPAYGNFTGITKVLLETGNAGPAGHNGVVDEVRLGQQFVDVAPIVPGLVFDGFQHEAMGGATIARSSDGSKLIVSNIGSSGQDGVEIKLHTLIGGGVVYEGTTTPNAPGSSCRQKYKGWDGTIKGICDTVTNADHTMTHTFDYTSMGATSVNVVQYNETGLEISNITYGGAVAVVPLVPPPCPVGSQFAYKTWYDIWVGGTHYLGYFCNDPINPIGMVKVTPEFAPGTSPDMTIDTVQVTASGMPELNIANSVITPRESPTRPTRPVKATARGLGNALLTEICIDGTDCTDDAARVLEVKNIGSSGEDGAWIDWRALRPRSTSGTIDLGDIFHSDAEATMRIRYLFGIRGSSLMVNGNLDGSSEVRPDFADVGSTQFEVVAYLNGVIVRQETHPNLDPIIVSVDQVICGPNHYPIWGWVTMWVWNPWPVTGSYQTHWGVIGCGSLGSTGGDPTYFDHLVFKPVNPLVPTVPDTVDSVSVTGVRTPRTVVQSITSSDAPNCPGDFDGDGTADFFDYDAFVTCFEGQACPAYRTADFDGDGAVDFFDYDAFVQAFETPC